MEILGMSAKVFSEEGYPGTDLQVIANRLKIGKGTVYRYFSTKEALFLATVDFLMMQLRDEISQESECATDPFDRINRAVRTYLRFFDAHPEAVELIIQERAEFRHRKHPTYFEYRNQNLGPWERLFVDLAQKGRIRKLPVRRIVDVLSDICYGAIFTNYFAKRKTSLETQAKDILDLFYRGILSDRERRSR